MVDTGPIIYNHRLIKIYVTGLLMLFILCLLKPRPDGYDPLKEMHLEKHFIRDLGEAGDRCWESILEERYYRFG